MRWIVSPVDSEATAGLVRELSVSSLLARLLVLRGVREPEAARRFLHPRLDQMPDPFLMAGMRAAVERLRSAVDWQEKILIYGDYDVDGTMASVVLLTALRALGGRVEAYIPHRLAEGYGMRAPVIERAEAENVKVVLSVDTGTREHDALSRARELGIDCIVTDHHLPDAHFPPALAILNPRRPDCTYPDKNLSGVGVAWKLAQALLGDRLSERQTLSYLKIVSIGTIADVVPLVGENRVIAHFGLKALGRPVQAGLEALMDVAGLKGGPITAGDVAFRIAPRLNAAGRMEDARDVIELLTIPDTLKARRIAEKLESLNRQRQQAESEIFHEIVSELEDHPEKAQRFAMVFSGKNWHRGVIGIVAQRIVERYHRPALVIGIEDGIGVGSGRSIKGFHLLDALASTGDLFQRYGGHAQAAGFTLSADRIGELEERFESVARAVLKPGDLELQLHVDAELDLGEIDRAVYQDIRRLEPYGFGNPAPVFAARGLGLLLPPRVLQDKHLKLKVGQSGKAFEALSWGGASHLPALAPGQKLNVAFSLAENVFNEMATLQLIIKDFQFQ